MSVAIEFRMKPLVQSKQGSGNAGDRNSSEGESKAFKQLKQDCQQLAIEHPGQVCFSTDNEVIEQAAHFIFRQIGYEEDEDYQDDFDEDDERDEGFQHDLL